MNTAHQMGFDLGAASAPPPGRRDADYYPTPRWAVRYVLPYLPKLTAGKPSDFGPTILEPACGDGRLLEVIADYYRRPDNGVLMARLGACDVRARAVTGTAARLPLTAGHTGSFLDVSPEAQPWGMPDLVVTNPPFKLALEFAEHAIRCVKPGGWVVMLLRLGFLGSAKRRPFLRRHVPDLVPLDRRPSFVGGATDSADYGWFIWQRGRTGPGRVTIP